MVRRVGDGLTMIQARLRIASKKATSCLHHSAFFSARLASRLAKSSAYRRNERQARFLGGDWRRASVDREHSREPLVLAQALMNHVLTKTPVPRQSRMRPNVQVGVVEHRPHGERLPMSGSAHALRRTGSVNVNVEPWPT